MTNDYGEVNGDILTTDSGSITISSDSGTITGIKDWGDNITKIVDPYEWKWGTPASIRNLYQQCETPKNNKKGDDDMRYLYEVILVNPKNDEFTVDYNIAKTETSALMTVYNDSDFKDIVKFDDLKTSCRTLMEYKEEKSLKKAIETIKKAVE